MGIAAGTLDRRVTIERFTAMLDAFGGEVKVWAPVATVWANVKPISDGERWRAGEVGATASVRITIRWGFSVGVEDRMIHDGRIYEIVGVKEIGRQVGQEITAGARAE